MSNAPFPRPETFEEIGKQFHSSDSVLLIMNADLTAFPTLEAKMTALMAEGERLGLTNRYGSLYKPMTDEDRADSLDYAQQNWDGNYGKQVKTGIHRADGL